VIEKSKNEGAEGEGSVDVKMSKSVFAEEAREREAISRSLMG
jgi:hypothetical protein